MTDTPQTTPAFLCLTGWAGFHRVPVAILGETPQRYRVRLLASCRLPSRRWGNVGDVVLVPKYAVREE